MKDISLIPFVISLIGFDNCLKEFPNVWKYGPEYTFRASVYSSFQSNDADEHMCSNMTIILKCRPFISDSKNHTDSLQCYIKDSHNQNSSVDESSNLQKNQEYGSMPHVEIKEPKFELFFHKKGLKEIKIDPSIEGWQLNVIRLIIIGLHEHVYFGDCIKYTTASEQIKVDKKQWTSKCGNKMQLGMYDDETKEHIIGINVTKQIDNCTLHTKNLFESTKMEKNGPLHSSETISRKTSLYIAPHSFEFFSQHESHHVYLNVTSSGPNFESLCLFLESIGPASLEFKRISIPSNAIKFTDIKDLTNMTRRIFHSN